MLPFDDVIVNLIPITTTLYLYIYHVECPLYVANLIIKVMSGSIHEWSQSILGNSITYIHGLKNVIWFGVWKKNRSSRSFFCYVITDGGSWDEFNTANGVEIFEKLHYFQHKTLDGLDKMVDTFEYILVREKFLILPQKPTKFVPVDPTATKSVHQQ